MQFYTRFRTASNKAKAASLQQTEYVAVMEQKDTFKYYVATNAEEVKLSDKFITQFKNGKDVSYELEKAKYIKSGS